MTPPYFSSPSRTSPRAGTALFVVRVVLGAIFLAHGYQKLFVFGLAGVTGGFTQMGIPMPGVTAPLIALLEFFGGIALVVGLLSRITALGFVCDMLGAIAMVHFKNGFFAPTGFEFPLALAGMSAAILIGGGGEFSLDGVLAQRRAGQAASPSSPRT